MYERHHSILKFSDRILNDHDLTVKLLLNSGYQAPDHLLMRQQYPKHHLTSTTKYAIKHQVGSWIRGT